jgi:hypothetical protein
MPPPSIAVNELRAVPSTPMRADIRRPFVSHTPQRITTGPHSVSTPRAFAPRPTPSTPLLQRPQMPSTPMFNQPDAFHPATPYNPQRDPPIPVASPSPRRTALETPHSLGQYRHPGYIHPLPHRTLEHGAPRQGSAAVRAGTSGGIRGQGISPLRARQGGHPEGNFVGTLRSHGSRGDRRGER